MVLFTENQNSETGTFTGHTVRIRIHRQRHQLDHRIRTVPQSLRGKNQFFYTRGATHFHFFYNFLRTFRFCLLFKACPNIFQSKIVAGTEIQLQKLIRQYRHRRSHPAHGNAGRQIGFGNDFHRCRLSGHQPYLVHPVQSQIEIGIHQNSRHFKPRAVNGQRIQITNVCRSQLPAYRSFHRHFTAQGYLQPTSPHHHILHLTPQIRRPFHRRRHGNKFRPHHGINRHPNLGIPRT